MALVASYKRPRFISKYESRRVVRRLTLVLYAIRTRCVAGLSDWAQLILRAKPDECDKDDSNHDYSRDFDTLSRLRIDS